MPSYFHIVRPVYPELCIVIPCFNEEAVLPQLFVTLAQFESEFGLPVRFLFVDDGSSDGTGKILRDQASTNPQYACIHFSRNFGHQIAVSAGLSHASGDVVAIIDADLQDPPCILLGMLEKWKEGYDVVYGVRKNRKENRILRAAYSTFYRAMKAISNIEIPLDAGDFSLMDRRVVDEINRLPERNRFVRGLRGWVGFRQIGYAYERPARAAGEAKYNMRKLLQLAMDGFINFSTAPLKIATWIGLLSCLTGGLLAIWTLSAVLFLDWRPPGWASLSLMILFFGGIQILLLGIIGEYIGRIFDEVKRRPHYIVDTTTGWLNSRATNTPPP